MVSDSSTGGEHDDRVHTLEDELRFVRNESIVMMGKLTKMMVTMMWSQGQGEQKESGGAEESTTVEERPEGALPLYRTGNSREFDARRYLGGQVGDRVRTLPEEVGPKRQATRSEGSR